ncbi:hypothetical protein FJU08_01625 [Martelella alba]|uniref:Uncharacterized protein n=1 Tax=Martelella alba TaxID=2590451 RepID=A0A506UIZ3_9HYPH|nr:hypothetical protein [Martelella alba]TPW33287.1 hypothetical protein FJU08_01625 [Martelella alba]
MTEQKAKKTTKKAHENAVCNLFVAAISAPRPIVSLVISSQQKPDHQEGNPCRAVSRNSPKSRGSQQGNASARRSP